MKKNYTLTFLFLLTILLGIPKTNAQTTLALGDLAFTSISMDGDSFSFVFLAPVLNGTTFYITDEGWTGTAIQTQESELLFTATDNIAAGEHVHITTSGALAITFSSGTTKGTITEVGSFPATSNMLGAAGDNLFIHQGPQGNPALGNFIVGINANTGSSPTNAWQTGTGSTSSSLLPSSLTEGQNAIGLFPPTGVNNEVDNAGYKAASLHIGTKADLLMALMDRSNWEVDNVTVYNPIADSFTVTDALGINSQKANNGIQVFPNPASQEFSISLPNNSILKNAKLYSITGELIKTIHTTNCNISSIASGVYLLKVETNEGSFTEKIVKK